MNRRPQIDQRMSISYLINDPDHSSAQAQAQSTSLPGSVGPGARPPSAAQARPPRPHTAPIFGGSQATPFGQPFHNTPLRPSSSQPTIAQAPGAAANPRPWTPAQIRYAMSSYAMFKAATRPSDKFNAVLAAMRWQGHTTVQWPVKAMAEACNLDPKSARLIYARTFPNETVQQINRMFGRFPNAETKYRAIIEYNALNNMGWNDEDMQAASNIHPHRATFAWLCSFPSPEVRLIRATMAGQLDPSDAKRSYERILERNALGNHNWSDRDMRAAAQILETAERTVKTERAAITNGATQEMDATMPGWRGGTVHQVQATLQAHNIERVRQGRPAWPADVIKALAERNANRNLPAPQGVGGPSAWGYGS